MRLKNQKNLKLDEARRLLNAAYEAVDTEISDRLLLLVREMIEPFVEARDPDALWLKCSLPLIDQATDQECDQVFRQQLEDAVAAGSVGAKFALACELDDDGVFERSSDLYFEAASDGHLYAMWCYGLNLMHGRGVGQNYSEGLLYIQRAADLNFEYAINFFINAFKHGHYGLVQDDELVDFWQNKLLAAGLVLADEYMYQTP